MKSDSVKADRSREQKTRTCQPVWPRSGEPMGDRPQTRWPNQLNCREIFFHIRDSPGTMTIILYMLMARMVPNLFETSPKLV